MRQHFTTLKRYFNPHLPHGRRRLFGYQYHGTIQHFNPHLPHGRRHGPPAQRYKAQEFQPTPPPREATYNSGHCQHSCPYFNPHLPHGRRLFGVRKGSVPVGYFNPHLPHGRRRPSSAGRLSPSPISTHTSPTGGDGRFSR